MRLFVGFLCLAMTLANPAIARMEGCSKAQEASVKTAVAVAKRLAVTAAANVRDDEHYSKWFGNYSPAAAETVRANFKSIARAIRTGGVTARCGRVGREDCEIETYAYVFSDEAFLVHICPPFFDQPHMRTFNPGTEDGENGSKGGTIVHEISHFVVVAQTEDHCYSRSECSDMAIRDPNRAIENADSYQYFAEDIWLRWIETEK